MTDHDPGAWLRLERDLDAPCELVWSMWTDPAHFAAWYGPDGVSVTVVAMDVRVGGARRIGMGGDGPHGPWQMWFAGEHRTVEPPHALTYSDAPADDQGRPLSREMAGIPSGHPLQTQVQIVLEALDGDRTHLTLTHVGIDAASPGAAGWQMAMAKLAQRLQALVGG